MFKRNLNIAAPTLSSHTTVHEHRAPTDDSARLAREFEAAAERKVIDAVRVTDTPVECVIHMREDFFNQKMTYMAVFKVGGAKLTANYDAKPDDDKDKVAIGIRDAMAKEIANLLVSTEMPNLFRKMGERRI